MVPQAHEAFCDRRLKVFFIKVGGQYVRDVVVVEVQVNSPYMKFINFKQSVRFFSNKLYLYDSRSIGRSLTSYISPLREFYWISFIGLVV